MQVTYCAMILTRVMPFVPSCRQQRLTTDRNDSVSFIRTYVRYDTRISASIVRCSNCAYKFSVTMN